MINLKTGEVDTEHSDNPAPFIIIDKENNHGARVLPKGILADVAPTILKLIGIRQTSMSGRNLLKVF